MVARRVINNIMGNDDICPHCGGNRLHEDTYGKCPEAFAKKSWAEEEYTGEREEDGGDW